MESMGAPFHSFIIFIEKSDNNEKHPSLNPLLHNTKTFPCLSLRHLGST